MNGAPAVIAIPFTSLMKRLPTASPGKAKTRVAEFAASVESLARPFAARFDEPPAGAETSAQRLARATRAVEGSALSSADIALAARLVEWDAAPRSIHVLGFKALSLLLTLLGFEVVCFEPDAKLRARAAELLQQLAGGDTTVEGRFAMREQSHADAGTPTVGNATLVLVTAGAALGDDRGAMLRALLPYEAVVLDTLPGAPDARATAGGELAADLLCHGFVAEPIVAAEDGSGYLLLRKDLVVVPLKRPFLHAGDHGWTTLLPEAFHASGDSASDPYRSDMWVLEDGIALGPPHAQHSDVRSHGKGRYSHWNEWLNFSTPDNSDPNLNGRRYAVAQPNRRQAGQAAPRGGGTVDLLADILKSREIKEVVYFHTDHFEPWLAERPRNDWWRALERFDSLTRGLRFGGKLSLFYSPLLIHQLYRAPPLRERWRTPPAAGVFRRRGDAILFRGGSPEFVGQCRDHLAPLEGRSGHEFHIHIHHEGWTHSSLVHPEIQGWMDRCGSLAKDSRRFDFFVGLCRETMAAELGRPIDHWAFAHGNWSLNASDPRFCNIADEIRILKRHGCYGDFTFPAGGVHCDPSLVEAPFMCDVRAVPKSYDRRETSPRPITEGAGDMTRRRFLIWNSPIKAARTSLDLWFPYTQRLLKQPEFLLRDWLAASVVIGNTLYIKTHAHSADQFYRLWEDDSVIPHAFPPVRQVFDLLERVVERARVPLTPMTVNQVFARLVDFDRKKTPPRAVRRLRTDPPEDRSMTLPPAAPSTRNDDRTLRRAELLLLDAMPEHTGADDGYYGARVAGGIVVEPYEREILDYACRHLDPARVRFIEAGAGWGMLCMLLAVAGFEVIALTGEPQYCETMRKLAARLEAAFPNYRGRLRIVEGFFPFALDNTLLGRDRENWLISTNVIHEFTHMCQDVFLAKAALCDRVIMDVATFARDRDAAEQRELKEFLSQGFDFERSLWQDRMFLMKSRTPLSSSAATRPPTPNWLVGETVHELNSGPMTQGGHCWSVELPAAFVNSGDTSEFPRRSPWRLLEDGVLLGPPHSMHSEIAELGRGRYSHWHGNLYYSASDNTHAATNRRKYTLARGVVI